MRSSEGSAPVNQRELMGSGGAGAGEGKRAVGLPTVNLPKGGGAIR